MDEPSVFPHLFSFPTKTSSRVDFVKGAEGGTKKESLPAGSRLFFESLTERREALLASLNAAEGVPEEVDNALQAYFTRLNHLLLPPPDASKKGTFEGKKLEGLWGFKWSSVLGGGGVSANDVRFEVASMLVNVALWKARRASELITSTAQITQSYKLLRESAGLVAHALKVVEPVQQYSTPDCSTSGLNVLMNIFLAEAQSLTTLRAIQKGNTAPTIASLAWDVYQLYHDAYAGLQSMSGKATKLLLYLEYKSKVFMSYAYSFHSKAHLDSMAGGEAVILSLEAQKECEQATQLGNSYDSSKPVLDKTGRGHFHEGLVTTVNKAVATAEEDNSKVYFKPIPKEIPEMPIPKRLVALIPFAFPSPDTTVDRTSALKADWKVSLISPGPSVGVEITEDLDGDSKAQGEGSSPAESKESAWWRWLLIIFAAPLLFVITVLGIIVWILLLPVKVFCCPIGCAAQILWSVVEWFVKAPLRAILWASGKPWAPEKHAEGKN